MKPTSSQPVRAAIYLRISLDREMDGLAIDRQREDCEKLAQFRGWEIVETYVDQSISASDKTKSALPTCGWSLTTRRGFLTRSCATTSTGSPDSLGNLKTGSTEQSPVAYFLSLRTATLTLAPTAGTCTPASRLRSRERRSSARALASLGRTSNVPGKGGHPKGFVRWAIPPLASSSLTRLRLCVPSTLPSFEGTRCTESHAPSAALRPTARRLGFRACPCTVGRSSSNAMLDGRLRASSFARCPMTSPGHPRRCSASCGTLAMRGTRSTPRRTLVGRRPGNRAVRPCPRQG